jgi:hypothetical protein
MKKEKKKETRERKPNWKEYMASVDDIKAFLSDRIYLRHNVITGRVECRIPERDYFDDSAPQPPILGDSWQPVTDRIVNSLWTELSKEKTVRVQDMYRVIESDYVPAYHPFRYYLDHLPPWDGENHILVMSLSVSVKGSTDEQMLFAEYLTKWLVAMVAGWVDPTVVNNVILVLIGEQGSYKTTWFNHLLPPELRSYFYTKTNANRMGRDDLLTLAQYGLVCCEELDTMRPSELNQLKAAVTMPSIDERAAYAHYHEHRKHIASFCGTGNNAQFLSDPTGNRRWLPFEVESIDSPRDHPFDYEAIYAQAYALYRQGFQYWFSRNEITRLSEHNRQFETPRLEYELASLYFCQPTGARPGEFMSVARAMQIVSANISQKLSAVYLGRALGELGFRRVKYNGVRGYVVVCRSGDEIHAAQQSMAMQAADDSGSVDSSGQCF